MSAAVAAPPSAGFSKALDWADEEDHQQQQQQQQQQQRPTAGKGSQLVEEKGEGNGIKVVVEYRTNEDGKQIKVTRRVRRTLIRTQVNQASVARQSWSKFGKEKGNPPGPHMATTTIGENVQLKLSAGGAGKSKEPEVSPEDKMKQELAGKKIQCRTCKGDHFTSRCPYKDTLGAITGEGDGEGDGSATPDAALVDPSNPAVAASSLAFAARGGGTGGKYVPPSLRDGAKTGERMGSSMNRDELPTLRVTNLSEDVQDEDMRDLFGRFGRIARLYVGRDRDTGLGRGFAFVSFEYREDADRARQRIDGMGYDNLVLRCAWSEPRGERPA
ncbi:translation initiation factor 3, RNA-binding subunit [Tilletiaria anomala UBC 951]|uniref:Eukaryotic translation initiation factor 3 subunit G n=1 Tax=Tilletiaria anomala (strain ATCC 24038 / CBS 436.72 / UBC 951) TaxID=1037660 RepID=A0A066VS01_TILAU|nr:translation initiation factor 3, RNA-binding subunit [Tilletiaria anomala UBC 951]KDN44497.1 translation initiation factor 3, RNA-binding subunit [Tilletiaria anomala UBC 951]